MAFSKLFKYACGRIKSIGVAKVITYCNRDWTPDYRDSVYYKNGFTFVKNTGSIMKYYNQKTGKIHSREKYQKHKLYKLFSDYKGGDVNKFLKDKGILRIYNSGNWRFEYSLK